MEERWNSGCRFGIALLDDDHRRQSDLIRMFVRMPATDDYRDIALRVLNRLRDVTAQHFRDEEKVMEAIQYSLNSEHVEQHRLYLDLFDEIIAELDRPASVFPFGVTKVKAEQLLRFWCDDHCIRHDAPLGHYIAARRAQLEAMREALNGGGVPTDALVVDGRSTQR